MNELSKNTISKYIVVLSIIFVFDLISIISSIYIAPVLDSFGMPDILVYLKLLVSLTTLVLFILHYNEKITLPYNIVKILLSMIFLFILAYFTSVFLYKMVLLNQVSDNILNKILRGNPAVILDVSKKNYNIIQYISTLNSGTNSEFFLLLQAIVIQYTISKFKKNETSDEPLVHYDDFLYDKLLSVLPITLLVLSFLSINLFTFKYDLLKSIEMGISMFAFAVVAPSVYLMYNFSKTKNITTTKSNCVSTHLYTFIASIICIVLFTALIGLNIAFLVLERGTYRIITASLALLVSIVMLIKSKYILSLENK